MPALRGKLHPVYSRLLPSFFDEPAVDEVRATCDKCSMCDHGEEAPVAMDFFHPDAKCCTYHPALPNYLVGALLADDGEDVAEGRRRMREKIRARIGVTPQWVAPPRKTTLHMSASRNAFGRSTALVCPYFKAGNGGSCTVWRHREAVCATYYCKYTAGKPGWEYWMALKDYMGHVERMLSYWSAHAVEPTVAEPKVPELRLTKEDLEDKPPLDAEYASYWGPWVGREEEFYIRCYEHVKSLPQDDFLKNVDDSPAGRGFMGKLTSKLENIDGHIVPARLVRNTKMKEYRSDDAVVVTTYNPFDSFKLEKELYDVLGLLKDDQTVDENLARLEKDEGIELTSELLQHLFTHGVLVPPEKQAAGAVSTAPGTSAAVGAHAGAIPKLASASVSRPAPVVPNAKPSADAGAATKNSATSTKSAKSAKSAKKSHKR